MALRRPLSRAIACNNCQQWVLRSFISGVSGFPTPRNSISSRQSFSITCSIRNEARERLQQEAKEEEHPLNDISDEYADFPDVDDFRSTTQRTSDKPQNEHLPWYLQAQQPVQQPESPLHSRQRLPELPPHAPPILQPLMEHVSVEEGIDDLNLLDLRSLDPPPALGANLLMIVGTARSERHLHVSADRLCRWLRSNYHLRPHADGLLGRNELKLKMKRRAKRSKLLSAVGAKATAQTEIDDGIRTGWVCVNVGRVEGGELPGQERRIENIVGFGPEEHGCNVVVQLMTEEKRGDIDLESLWEETLVKARKKKEKESIEEAVDENVQEDQESRNAAESRNPAFPSSYRSSTSSASQSIGRQVRAFHTSTRRLQNTASATASSYKARSPMRLQQSSNNVPDPSSTTEKLASMIAELKSMSHGQRRRAPGPNPLLATNQIDLDSFTAGTNLMWSTEASSSPPLEVLAPVEVDAPRSASEETTPFLRTFYDLMPPYPTAEHWHYHIELLAQARLNGKVHSPVLFAQLTNMQLAGLIPQERTFKLVLEAAIGPMGSAPGYDGEDELPSTWKLHTILTTLETMEEYGYDPVSPCILELLYRTYVGPPHPGLRFDVEPIIQKLGLARLGRLARTNDWPTFWQTWRSYPQRFLPRSADMYAVLFTVIAEGHMRNRKEATAVLRASLEEMGREQPAVKLEENVAVADAVMRAVEFIQPDLDVANNEDEWNAEWKQWHERCLNVRVKVPQDKPSTGRGKRQPTILDDHAS